MLKELNMVTGATTHEDDVERELTIPVTIDLGQVRYFHPRKYGKTGTRLSFRNGSALAVSDTYESIKGALAGA